MPSGGTDETRPHVSVIVPVLNDPLGIAVCLRALLGQTFPPHRFEIIVADNGSTDGTRAVVERVSADAPGHVRVVVESEMRSSYAARNRALQEARGEIIAFIDADCTPSPTWVEEGVRALEAQGGGAVAGRVDFTYRGDRPNAYEYWDSAVHMNQEDFVRRLGFGATANLFTYRQLFRHYGAFCPDLTSGGDREFCHRLRLGDAPVAYAADAVVQHPARATLGALLEKRLRLARAHRGLHRLGVLGPRRHCAYRGLRVLRTCPRPRGWQGRLSRTEMGTVLILRNLSVWMVVAVCLAQGASDRFSAWLAVLRPTRPPKTKSVSPG